MSMKETTQALNDLTVDIVGSFLGLQLPLKGMTRCPLPDHNDKTPSFEVRHHGRRWVCYACNKSGGAIDLVMEYQGMEFLEAKQWLAGKKGLLNDRWRAPSAKERPAKTRQELPNEHIASEEETAPDFEVYKTLLERAPMRSSGLEYLKGRKISEKLIEKFSVGQVPEIEVFKEIVEEYGFKRVNEAGLLTKRSSKDEFYPVFPKGAILFPYIEGINIAYFQSRSIDDINKNGRWRNLNHRRRRIYNVDALRGRNVKRVAICEGVLDTLSAIQMKCDAIGFVGVSASLSKDEMISLRGKQVDLFLDWDDAGNKRASLLRKELARFGVPATRRTAPRSGATDLNALLCEGWVKI